MTNGFHHHTALVKLFVGFVVTWGKSALLIEDGFDTPCFQAGDPTIFNHDILWTARVDDDHTFLTGFLDLLWVGQKVCLVFESRQDDFDFSVGGFLQPCQCSGDVHGDVAATDHHCLPGGTKILPSSGLSQQINRFAYVGVVTTGNAGSAPQLQSQAQQHRVVCIAQLGQADILANGSIAAQVDADRPNHVHVFINDVVGQPVLRDAPAGHTARFVERLKHRHTVSFFRQIKCGRQACRASANNCDFFASRRGQLANDQFLAPLKGYLVHDVALKPTDRNGVSFVTRGTGGLTFVGADPSTDTGEWIGLVQQFNATFVVAVSHCGNVVGDRHVGWAGGHTQATRDAAVGFGLALLDRVTINNFSKRADSHLRRELVHVLAYAAGQLMAFRAAVT